MNRPSDQEIETLVLGTMRSPGVVTLSGHDRTPKWDDQPAKGKTGASTTLNDPKPPGSFKASFYLADDSNPRDIDLDSPNDFDEWDKFQRLVESMTNGPKPFALPIYHPDLARNGFTEVTNGGVSGFVHDGKGGATVTVTFKEYKPAKPKPTAKPTAKPAGAIAGQSAKPDPNAAAKAELAGLLAQARAP